MSFVDSILNVMHMNPDDDADYYDDYYDDEEEEEVEPPRSIRSKKATPSVETSHKKSSGSDNQPIDINRNRDRGKSNAKVTPMRPSKKASSAGIEICAIKPTSFDDAREITETLLMNRPVILNVEGLDVDVAQRIIDFASGSCFAISGNLQKISNYIFIITPSNVEISGDFLNMLDSYGGSSIRTDY